MKISEAISILGKVFRHNLLRPDNRISVIFWGEAGIGKTTSLIEWAKSKNYRCRIVPVAQLEETGDLLGMPQIQGGRTRFVTPEYLPTEEAEGILVFDDFNRANRLILQALLHIIQFYEIIGYSVPRGWTIVLTGNEATGGYMVEEVDTALLTRVLNLKIEFDPWDWIKWGLSKGFSLELMGFAILKPEVISREAPPRAWSIFLSLLSSNPELIENRDFSEIRKLGTSIVGDENAAVFTSYLRRFISPFSRLRYLFRNYFKKDSIGTFLDLIYREITRKFDIDIETVISFAVRNAEFTAWELREAGREDLAKEILSLLGDFLLQVYYSGLSTNDFIKAILSDVVERNPELKTHPRYRQLRIISWIKAS